MGNATIVNVHKYGRNLDLDAAVPETIWDKGGSYVWPSGSEKVKVVSSSVADTAAGTGLRTIRIDGLDANWDLQSETITLNGTTPVEGDLDFLRVFKQKGLTAGSGGTNAGIITCSGVISSLVFGAMVVGMGNSQLGLYSVPRLTTMELDHIFCTSLKLAASGAWEVRMMIREFGQTCWNLRGTIGGHTQSGPSHRWYRPALVLPAKCDIEFIGEATANNTSVALEFDARLYTSAPDA